MLRPEEQQKKRILISPLNWGWGHVARCIPLIDQLQRQGNTLFVACSSDQERVFREYLDDVTYIAHADYPFAFGGKGRFASDMFYARKPLQARLSEEEKEVAQYVKTHKIDLVLADHRYGFRSEEVPSVFITHQVNLPVPFWLFPVQSRHRTLMQRFSAWWIMDFEDQRLAGKLSHSRDPKAHFIGPYSRFSLYDGHVQDIVPGTRVAIASGPKIYADQFAASERMKLKEGDALVHAAEIPAGTWRSFDTQILQAEVLIARSGYSTLMDLHVLKKKAELSPTPGQAEQIYLHRLHADKMEDGLFQF